MNPYLALGQVGLSFLTSPRPPSQASVDQAFAETQAANRQQWLIGGALFAGAVLLYVFGSRR